ncbi:hypothetical protein HHL24_20650 [Paraburkholderia sp. RP-4-7]|uniref:Uncharacterized protein n=1 Tax=Paraburkholderia polaris TaxID=2728848 RepID=A0A848IJH6_9BURK|nr:hypothetical protein [Paraburkholderia polaris]NMM00339.1 hypothetical protein [Paraburkholderia polaris]
MDATIDQLKKSGLVTDDQVKAMGPDERKLIESLTPEEIKALESIKNKAQGTVGTLQDGNIIF